MSKILRSVTLDEEDVAFIDQLPRTFQLSKFVREALKNYKKELEQSTGPSSGPLSEKV